MPKKITVYVLNIYVLSLSNSLFFFSYRGCTGDFEHKLSRNFGIVYGVKFWGCNTHYASNIGKHSPKFWYKKDAIQRDWESSLRYLTCLPKDDIMRKVITAFDFSKNTHINNIMSSQQSETKKIDFRIKKNSWSF